MLWSEIKNDYKNWSIDTYGYSVSPDGFRISIGNGSSIGDNSSIGITAASGMEPALKND